MLSRRLVTPVRAIAFLGAAVASLAGAGCGSAVPITPLCSTPGPAAQPDSFNQQVTLTRLPSGLQEGDIVMGCGHQVRSGQQVTVEYTGWLQNGTEFDSSRSAQRQPFAFALGQGQVIPGFDLGVMNMNIGGKRRLVIPPSLAYGAQGVPPVIPPNATLIFTVEVIAASG